MTDHDDHIQHTWILTHPTGDEVTIDLWTDGESVRVEGGQGESTDGGRKDVDRLIERYCLRGYWITNDYAVNDPHEPELPDDRPDGCPECGQPCEFVDLYDSGTAEGPAWLCTGCRWRVWSVGT